MKCITVFVFSCIYLLNGVLSEPFIGHVPMLPARPFPPLWVPLDDADYWAERSARFAKDEITVPTAGPYNVQVTSAWGSVSMFWHDFVLLNLKTK